MFVYFSSPILENLIQQVNPSFFSLLPLLLLPPFFFQSFFLDQSVQLFLISCHLQSLVLDSSSYQFCLFSLSLFHVFFVLGQLSFFLDDSLDHLSIDLSLQPSLLLFIWSYFLILDENGLADFFLPSDCLKLLQFGQFALPLPLLPQHLFLLSRHQSLLILFSLLQIFLYCQDRISLINFLLMRLSLQSLNLVFLSGVSFVQLCKQHLLYIRYIVPSYFSWRVFCLSTSCKLLSYATFCYLMPWSTCLNSSAFS